ncbi:MAG: lipoprotein-releasing system permease protein [Lentisphaeria bacterium]|jgi:lipoprotein-releasing system permease protein
MNILFPFFIGLRYTVAKRSSQSVSFLSGVSITGLALGVSLLVLVLSVMNGVDRELRQRILGLVPQAAVYHHQGIDDWRSIKTQLEKDPAVVAASPFIQLNGLISYRKNTTAMVLFGFDPTAEKNVSLINDYVGPEVLARIEANDNIIVLGKGIADTLGVVVGGKLMVLVPNLASASRTPHIAYFEVAGIVESKTELDSTLALTSLMRAAQLTSRPHRVDGVRLKLENIFDAPNVVYGSTLALGPGYYGSNWTRTHWNLYQAIQMSKNLVGLLMSLLVAIAAFNVVSTLVLVVVDKQGDIAILQTLGVSTRQIMSIFIIQGIFIGVVGTLIGVLVGCLLALGLQDFVHVIETVFDVQFLKSDVYPLTYLPTEIRLSDISTVVLTALGMSVLATIYPAWKASKIQPAEALRYE